MYHEGREEASERQDAAPSVVGWVGTGRDGVNDTHVPEYCSRVGALGYSFMNYPVGGMRRASWRPERDVAPPPIDLPDLQLTPRLWSVYVVARVSPWIDCDSNEEWLAELSRNEIEKELNYMNYMPMRVLTIELKHRDSPRLAEILTKWLWSRNMSFSIWVFVPTDENRLPVSGRVDTRDIWSVWADFRTLCTNYPVHKFALGLHLCADLADEFLEPRLYRRWNAEPLMCFWIDSNVFMNGPRVSESILGPAHYRLLSDLFVTMVQRAVISVDDEAERVGERVREQYVSCVKRIVCEKMRRVQDGDCGDAVLLEYLGHHEYVDSLQIPLQPLADNLDSGTYTTFEEDNVKYELYRRAILSAIPDVVQIVGDSRDIVVYLLGAGRGPLMRMIMEAENMYNAANRSRRSLLRMQLVAVEKNGSAIVTLRFLNEAHWGGRVTVVESDMRSLSERVRREKLPLPDLIVSELLGSFGDNELSPECIDGVTDILRPTTISIPHSYTSFVAPIQSLRMHQKVIACNEGKYYDKGIPGRGRLNPVKQPDGTYALPSSPEVSPLDEIYVVYLRAICELDEPKPVFTFSHPNFAKTSNARKALIDFTVDKMSELMGFAAYFEAQLYGETRLSILPKNHSKSMVSWFPALIPLRKLLRVGPGTKIGFHIERKVDENGVWYEWFVEYRHANSDVLGRTELQNANGMSYYMRL